MKKVVVFLCAASIPIYAGSAPDALGVISPGEKMHFTIGNDVGTSIICLLKVPYRPPTKRVGINRNKF